MSDVEKSKDGKNAYVLACPDVYHGQRHYAVCLKLIGQHEDGKDNLFNQDCMKAMKKGACPAMAMRQKEIDAGEALFYQKRETDLQKVTIFDPSYQRGWQNAGRQISGYKPPKSVSASSRTRPVKAKRKAKPKGSLHEQLVNKLMEKNK